MKTQRAVLLITTVVISATLLIGTAQARQEADFKPPALDAASRLAWHAQHLKMRDESDTRELKWQHIGPMQMSGRVTEIAKPLDRPFTFYVATASGGVWRTRNEGTDWEPIFEDAPSASTGAITVDPNDSKTIWVGLGEANIFRSSMAGMGGSE